MNTYVADIRAFAERDIAYKPMFARIAGGACPGIFLSQAFYWQSQVAEEGWWYKTANAWEVETCLTHTEQETARKALREKGLLEEKRAGLPARLFYRLNLAKLSELCQQDWEARCGSSDNQDAPKPSNKDDCSAASYNKINPKENSSSTANAVEVHAPPSKPKSAADSRRKHPAIQLCFALNCQKYPPKPLWDALIIALGNNPDGHLAKSCQTEWLKRGYLPTSWTWAIEWYPHGGPPKNGNGKSASKSSIPTSAEWDAIIDAQTKEWRKTHVEDAGTVD